MVLFDAKGDAKAQAKALDDAVSAGYDAIILIPVNGDSLADSVDRAAKAGIPVFTQKFPPWNRIRSSLTWA